MIFAFRAGLWKQVDNVNQARATREMADEILVRISAVK